MSSLLDVLGLYLVITAIQYSGYELFSGRAPMDLGSILNTTPLKGSGGINTGAGINGSSSNAGAGAGTSNTNTATGG